MKTRDFYLPSIGTKLELPTGLTETDCVVYTYLTKDKLCAIGFKGKSIKPSFRYSFKTIQQRNDHIVDFYLSVYKEKQAKEKRKKENNDVKYNVGNILYESWGYDQTNVNFYQVIEVKGTFITIREIKSKIFEQKSYDSGTVVPVKDKFIGEPLKRKAGNYVKIKSYSSAALYDGSPKYFSSYA
jgi:hypothetical protein